jgi:hypothetical protein
VWAVVADVLRTGTGGDDQPLEGQRVLAVGPVDSQLPAGEIEAGGHGSELPRDIEFVEDVGLAQVDAVRLPLPRQQLLRQGWAIVGPVQLGTEHHHLTAEPALTQRFRRTQSGERRPDDDDPVDRDPIGRRAIGSDAIRCGGIGLTGRHLPTMP